MNWIPRWWWRKMMCSANLYPGADHVCLRVKHEGDAPHVCKCGAQWENDATSQKKHSH